MSLADEILNYTPPQNVKTTLRGKPVYVRQVSAADHLEIGRLAANDPSKFAVHLLARAVVDEAGERVFPDDSYAEKLGKLAWSHLRPAYEAALEINKGDTDPNG